MPRQSLDIIPRERKYWLLLVVCLAFTALLVYRLCLGQPIRGTLFSLPLAFFAIFLILKRFKSPKTVSLTITPEGLEFHYLQGNMIIPWTDVRAVGAFSFGSKDMVGIRLKSYDHYLEAMPHALMEYMLYERPYEGSLFFSWVIRRLRPTPHCRRVFSRNPALLVDQTPPTLWSGFAGLAIPAGFDGLGSVGLMVQTLLFSRLSTGYDLMLPRSEIDRSVAEFVAILEGYLAGR